MQPLSQDPVKLLLLAYEEADLFAAIHYQAIRTSQRLAHCYCAGQAQHEFRRKFKRLS